jgi:uncharacterized protein YjbI with pentapeptide repeats
VTKPDIRNNRGGGIPAGMPIWRELVQVWTDWVQVRTHWTDGHPFSWFLHILEVFVLMGGAIGPLLIANQTKADASALSVQVSRQTYEFLVLGLLVLFWVGWCEGGYRLGRQMENMENIAQVPWQRRLTLELWTGILFSLIFSVLTSLGTLLPLLAVFLMFAGIESLKAPRSEQTLWDSVLRGFRGSFRKVSQDPLRFLILLAVPGLLLYLISLILRICQILFRDLLVQLTASNHNTTGGVAVKIAALATVKIAALGILIFVFGLLGVWLFYIARMDLAINYLRIQRNQVSDPFLRLDAMFNCVRQGGRALVASILLILLFYSLYELVTSNLFSRNFFYTTLEACVRFVNDFAQKMIDLLAKLSFILVIFALIMGLCLLLVSLASRGGKGIMNDFLSILTARLESLSDFIKEHINIPGQVIQITTILSAFGIIATQAYARIIEAQSLRLEQRRQQEQQVKLQQQQQQNYGDRADNQIQLFQQTLQSLLIKGEAERNWLDLDRRSQVASLTRNLLRQLESPDGKPDGPRRAKILKYLYDSRFLYEDKPLGIAGTKKCKDALSNLINNVSNRKSNDTLSPRTLDMLPQFSLDKELTQQVGQITANSRCNLARLVPLKMDFSYASLGSAFLDNAKLPFINLSNADLSNAQLREADLRFANLENANLKGADLRGAKLDFGNLTNAELRGANLDKASFNGAILFYATRNKDIKGDQSWGKGSLSWELTRQKKSNNEDKRYFPIFCPLDLRMDPESLRAAGPIVQAGAKCNNRIYSGYDRRSDQLSNRNWASGDFGNTTIENFRLNGIDFTNADLRGAVFRYVQLNDVVFIGANLDGARFENCVLNNVDFTGASIRQMAFVGSSVERLTFRGSQYVLPIKLGDYADDLLLLSGRNMDISSTSNQSPPARLAQSLLRPLLLAPFPLRPSRVLIWLVPYSPELLFSSDNRQSIP